jgi:hypothetical protein
MLLRDPLLSRQLERQLILSGAARVAEGSDSRFSAEAEPRRAALSARRSRPA